MITARKFPTISDIFNLLNDWRHLPFYSLETCAAPFFAVFLHEILSNHFDREFHEILIPEFPLRIGTLYEKSGRTQISDSGTRQPSDDQSYNVDYVAFAKDKKTAYFIELKTDMGSRRREQDEYLHSARQKRFTCFVDGIVHMARASKKKQKYMHLLHLLSAPGIECISIPADTRVYEKAFPRVVPGWTKALGNPEIDTQHFPNTQVVFVQPISDSSNKYDFEYVDFDAVATIVETRGDLGAMFANYLRQWTKVAGSVRPKEFGLCL